MALVLSEVLETWVILSINYIFYFRYKESSGVLFPAEKQKQYRALLFNNLALPCLIIYWIITQSMKFEHVVSSSSTCD